MGPIKLQSQASDFTVSICLGREAAWPAKQTRSLPLGKTKQTSATPKKTFGLSKVSKRFSLPMHLTYTPTLLFEQRPKPDVWLYQESEAGKKPAIPSQTKQQKASRKQKTRKRHLSPNLTSPPPHNPNPPGPSIPELQEEVHGLVRRVQRVVRGAHQAPRLRHGVQTLRLTDAERLAFGVWRLATRRLFEGKPKRTPMAIGRVCDVLLLLIYVCYVCLCGSDLICFCF